MAGRFAAILAVLDRLVMPDIEVEQMERAVTIARWYLREALRMEGLNSEPQEQQDAVYILEKAKEKGWELFTMEMTSKLTRNKLKSSRTRVRNALDLLMDWGKVTSFKESKGTKKTIVWKFVSTDSQSAI